jgi:hypothetical protein
MTNNPNIKLLIAKRAIKSDGNVDIPKLASEHPDIEQRRFSKKVSEMYPILDYGVSPRHPWIHDWRRLLIMTERWMHHE